MTTSFLLEPQPFRRGPSAEVAVVVGLVSIVAVLTFFLAGAAFLGLAIAPIASPAAEVSHIRIADFWWLFAGLSIASFAAAATVAARASAFVSPRD
ncbi:MAG TPA: hypothetical protein VID95_09085 [Candidatus Limnocylindrales bacterium]